LIRAIVVFQDITKNKRAEETIGLEKRQLAVAQQVSHVGSWEWDIRADLIHGSEELYRIFEIDVDHAPLTFDAFLQLFDPKERAIFHRIVQQCLKDHAPYDIKSRIFRP